ncbi:Solvent efflux pump periplasmic linker SrpA [Pseudomonas fluorescens]|uniref:Solvent efflux pump periplasmic linker SrpA n=2 Tax=Pseudomonas fluorescens TaxID=294 RepID=A0A5E7EL88_PSEFL|nr:Solvent efflux pump periplasmic linker SrpA [Pseudomonas fluorescens]
MKHRGPYPLVRRVPVAAFLLLAGCDMSEPVASTPSPAQVGVYTLEAQSLTLATDLPGRTAANRVAEVRPQVSGILVKRMVAEGTEVKQGQQLYQIDPRTYQAHQARAQANLVTASNLAKRYERLLKTNAVSRQQYDDAFAAWKQAQAEARMADINVQYTRVLSPISGRIGRSAVTEGALVTDGQAQELATVTQLDPIYVDVTQPITQLLKLRRALESGKLQKAGEDSAAVSLTLDDGSVYGQTGTMKFSEVNVDPSTGSVTLRAQFPNPDRQLLPGMFVHAQVKEGVRENAILVPQQAVFRDSRGVAQSWVVKNDGSVELREIETLRTVGNAWLVGKGLSDGERVVTEGLQRVRSGIKVQASDASNVDLANDLSKAAATAVSAN